MREIGHFINGKQVAGTSGRFADVYNPATGEVQARVALATKAELDAAVAAAARAQIGWGATNPQRRARVMMKFAELINRDMDKLAEALSREHGKTIPDAKGDVQRGLEVIEVCMGDEPLGHVHEFPRLRTKVEAKLEFRNTPVTLHRGT